MQLKICNSRLAKFLCSLTGRSGPEKLKYLENLLRINNIYNHKILEYVKLTELRIFQYYYQLEVKLYEQENGTAIGNSVSPFIAELFIRNFNITMIQNSKY